MGKLIVFSGAGLSAESGLPTFRNSPEALWENHSLDKVCNYRNWEANYDLVHRFYNHRREQLGQVEPNLAHRLIADWQRRYETVILTQNVDDLLERAGCTNVVHLHGFLPEMHCEACNHIWRIGYQVWGENNRCPRCRIRESVKPNVVFFHQDAPRYRDLYAIMANLTRDDVVVVTGTSGQVIPIDSYLFDRPGHKVYNSLDAPTSDAYHRTLLMPASEAFPLIDAILKQRLGD